MRVAALALTVTAALVLPASPARARDSRCDRASSAPLAPAAIPPDATRATLEAAGAEAWRRGEARAAIDAWRAAIALGRARGERAGEADTSLRLARGWRALGEPERALQALTDVPPVAGDDAARNAWNARAELERSAALRALGRHGDARAAAERAVAAARESRDQALLAQSLGARAAAAHAWGLYAEPDWRDALAVAGAASANAAALRLGHARALAETGSAGPARDELLAARSELAALERSADRARLFEHAALTWRLLAAAEADSASRSRDRLAAAEALRSALDDASALGDARQRSFAEGELGEIYDEEGRGDEAEQLARRALFSAQAASAPESAWRWQRLLGHRLRASGRVDEALVQLRASARTLAQLGARAAPAGDPIARAAAESARVELVDLLLERAAFTEDAKARSAFLFEARDALEQSKTDELRDYFRDECLASERRVVPEALPATVVVYPVVLPDRTELLVSRADTIRAIRVPIGAAELGRDAHALRALLEKRTTRQYLPLAQQMYDRLLRPLEPILAEPGVETLVFVPGGPLRMLPLGALHDRETGKFLIEKIPVAVVPGLSLVEPRALDRERARVLEAGLSESVQGYLPLPAVEAELAAVHAAFGGTTLLNRDFVTSAVEHAVESQPYGIVHIASHGEFHGDPEKSFLLTWDGRLALERLADVVSVTRFRDQPLELLTLSACETAAGDERAALGLAGVAVRAGARSALATLWSIPDESAAEVVSEFYRQLAQPGMSRAQALQRAQVSVLSRVEYRHPGYWAPFLLISSWL